MVRTFKVTEGNLAGRLLTVLDAGENFQGRRSAPLTVVVEGGGYRGQSDRVVDLCVKDHADPVRELVGLRYPRYLYFGETKPDSVFVSLERANTVIYPMEGGLRAVLDPKAVE